MNPNSQLNERLKKAKAELQEEDELLTQSSQDRLTRMEDFVKYIDIAYDMSDKNQKFGTFMKQFRDDSNHKSAEDRYLSWREYNDPTNDTNQDYKNYKVSCCDIRGDMLSINTHGHRYLKKAEEKLVKYFEELKCNPQYHTKTLKDLIKEANRKQQPLEDIYDRRAKLENEQLLVILQKQNTKLTQGFLGFFNKIFKSGDIERNRVDITRLEYEIYGGTEINFRAKAEISQQTYGSKASKNNIQVR